MEITVNTSTLAGDIEELRRALSSARTGIEEMFGQMAELDTMWEGPANQEFRKQFGNDYENARSVCEKVEWMLACMEKARERYDQCEHEVNDVIAAIAL